MYACIVLCCAMLCCTMLCCAADVTLSAVRPPHNRHKNFGHRRTTTARFAEVDHTYKEHPQRGAELTEKKLPNCTTVQAPNVSPHSKRKINCSIVTSIHNSVTKIGG